MKFSFTLLAGIAAVSQCLAAPNWPASTDELEDFMYLTTGYRRRTFTDSVTPCSKSPNTPGRINAAEWMRTCFHDMAPASSGVGGLDASLMFETGRSENVGPAFQSTFIFLQEFFSVRASISDLLALSMYASVRACGGPVVPIRGGRIDAAAAGPSGVPQPENPTLTLVTQFARMGFNKSEMIEVTACGHTLGGVHADSFPLIVAPGTAPNNYALFDDQTQAQSKFDNKVATDFVAGNTTNPLVGGLAKQRLRDSDFRVFTTDNNATIKTLTDREVFQERCAVVLQKLIDVVPAAVTLTDPIQPYDIKPVNPQLTLLAGGASLSFAGEIRVRTTVRDAAQIATVELVYKNRSGGAGGTISTSVAGTGSGFDDTFTFYKFSAPIDSTTSISSFTVVVTLTGGDTETHDNNGGGYPVQDSIIYQFPQSCLGTFTDSANERQLTVVAAKRTTVAGTPAVDLAVKTARTDGVVVPSIVKSSLPMTAGAALGPYTFYSATTGIGSTLSLRNSFDVSVGDARDAFKLTANMGATCAALGDGDSSSSSSAASPTSTSVPPTSTSTSVPPTSSTSSTTPTPTGWSPLGCYPDTRTSRTLPHSASAAGPMTNTLCQSACLSAGYPLAGTEYSGECWCGSSLGDITAAPAADCAMPCAGDAASVCGGADRLSVSAYSAPPQDAPPDVAGYKYVGCRVDSRDARVLPERSYADAQGMTLESCAAYCGGYKVWGTEYAGECWCADELAEGAGVAAEVECDMKCTGDAGEVCGGSDRLSVYARA